MAKASLVLGLSGRGLRDLDLFSKSDPYVVLSRSASFPWCLSVMNNFMS